MQNELNNALLTAIQANNTESEESAQGEESTEEAKSPEYTIADLVAYRDNMKRGIQLYTSRGPRIEKLMQRKSASKWSPEKKQKMIRRLEFANQYVKEAPGMIEMITVEITKRRVDLEKSKKAS